MIVQVQSRPPKRVAAPKAFFNVRAQRVHQGVMKHRIFVNSYPHLNTEQVDAGWRFESVERAS